MAFCYMTIFLVNIWTKGMTVDSYLAKHFEMDLEWYYLVLTKKYVFFSLLMFSSLY